MKKLFYFNLAIIACSFFSCGSKEASVNKEEDNADTFQTYQNELFSIEYPKKFTVNCIGAEGFHSVTIKDSLKNGCKAIIQWDTSLLMDQPQMERKMTALVHMDEVYERNCCNEYYLLEIDSTHTVDGKRAYLVCALISKKKNKIFKVRTSILMPGSYMFMVTQEFDADDNLESPLMSYMLHSIKFK